MLSLGAFAIGIKRRLQTVSPTDPPSRAVYGGRGTVGRNQRQRRPLSATCATWRCASAPRQRGSLTQSLRDPTDLVRDPFDVVNEIAYSSDGQHVAGVTDQGLIVIWQVSDGRIVRTIG